MIVKNCSKEERAHSNKKENKIVHDFLTHDDFVIDSVLKLQSVICFEFLNSM